MVAEVGENGSVLKDVDDNLRYAGNNPNNYILFNNELWRVIGVFDGQLKLIRKEFYNSGIPFDANNSNNWC